MTQLTEHPNRTALPRGHGRGPGGQPAALQLPAGRCPVPGCGEQIDRTRLMCRRDWYLIPRRLRDHVRDWYLIPRRLRDHVWESWGSGRDAGSHEHQEAVFNAIAVARIARLPPWRRQLT